MSHINNFLLKFNLQRTRTLHKISTSLLKRWIKCGFMQISLL